MGYLTPEAFAAKINERGAFNVTAWWVRRELIAGRIVGAKIRRRWFIDEDEIPALMKRNSNQGPDAQPSKARAS